ncbi:intraflagellar transport protein 57 homolog [Nannochloropsis oceanica]
MMESIVEKLKVLDLKGAGRPLSCPPPRLDRLSFVVKQPRQHALFLTVASWLCNRLKGESDPTHCHTTVEALVADLSNLQLCGMSTGEEMAALKLGYGKDVCRLLDILCNAALAKIGFVWQAPVYVPSEETLNKAESEEAAAAPEKNGSTSMLSFTTLQPEAKLAAKLTEAKESKSCTSPDVAEGKSWDPKLPLKHDEESESKEQRCRERVGQVKVQINEAENAHQIKQGRVDTLKIEFGRLQDRCDRLQREEEEALRWEHPSGEEGSTWQTGGGSGGKGGERMAYDSPMVMMRRGLEKVNEEIKAFDVRIGVMQHILLHRAGRLRALEEEEEEDEEEETRRGRENEQAMRLY